MLVNLRSHKILYPKVKAFLRVSAYLFLLLLICGYVVIKTPKENYNVKHGYNWEKYDPSLNSKLRSIDDILTYTDRISANKDRHSEAYISSLQEVLSKRFFNGYSYYSFHQNWITYLAGKFIWKDLDAIVSSRGILMHPYAACSQVAIVFSDCLRQIGIPYRKVTLQNHFILEGKVNNDWVMLDANLEPNYPNGMKSVQELKASSELFTAYKGHKTVDQLNYMFSKINYGQENERFAIKTFLFQRITLFLSAMIAISLLFFVMYDLAIHLFRTQPILKQNKIYRGYARLQNR